MAPPEPPADKVQLLSTLVGEIYDAALDRSLWPAVLKQTCDYVEGCASALISHDSLQHRACFHFTWNDNPEYTKLYVEKYAKLNPAIVPATIQCQVGEVSTLLDFVPLEQYRATRLYKEWSAPQGYIDSVQAVIDKSATSYAAATVMRHDRQGPVDAEARDRMRLLAPHFRRAVNIGRVIDLKKAEASTLADTLDAIAVTMLLVDESGRIVHANKAGHALLAEGSVMRAVSGKLTAIEAPADRALHEVFLNSDTGDIALGARGISVPLAGHDGEQYVAHVLPLTSGARRRAAVAYSAVAAVFVRKARLDRLHPLEAIANVYKLTPAEMRVLMMIVEVGGVPEVAPVLGISETTVKTHLQRVFEKTGTNRQVDLVKLVAGFMSPIG